MNVMLVLLVAIAVVYDLRERRIPNWLVLCGGVLALGAALFGGGLMAFGKAMLASLLGVAAFFPFFMVRLVGAGDAKLFGMVGSFVGLPGLLPVLFYTVLVGGVIGVLAILFSGTASRFLQNLKLILVFLVYRAEGSEVSLNGIASQSAARIPYAVAIAAGVLIWMVRQS